MPGERIRLGKREEGGLAKTPGISSAQSTLAGMSLDREDATNACSPGWQADSGSF